MQTAGGTALTSHQAGRGGRRHLATVLATAGVVYVADVVSKVAVVATLSPAHPVRLLGGFLTLRLTRNSGAAFSIGTSLTVVFALIAVGVIAFILHTARRLRSRPWAFALGLLLGGATGNLTDRLLRGPGVFRGDVVDWIQVPHWPVFNIADSAIVCGGILAVLLAARGIRLDGTRDGRQQPAAEGRGAATAGGVTGPAVDGSQSDGAVPDGDPAAGGGAAGACPPGEGSENGHPSGFLDAGRRTGEHPGDSAA
jgi:signal peptidase II